MKPNKIYKNKGACQNSHTLFFIYPKCSKFAI